MLTDEILHPPTRIKVRLFSVVHNWTTVFSLSLLFAVVFPSAVVRKCSCFMKSRSFADLETAAVSVL